MKDEEQVSFPNGRGQTLKGVLHHPAGSESPAAVILCHGMESNKESGKLVSLSRMLTERGILALRFDFAYAGESSGKFEEITYSGEVEDLQAAFKFMLRYQIRKIAILGSSMGGTVALLFAAKEKRVTTLVTIAAPLHPENITERLLTQEEVKQWRQEGFATYHGRRINASFLDDLQQINIPEAAKKISCPVLVIHGDADETVPVEDAYELHSQLTSPKRICILKGADHRLSNPCLLEDALKESIDWITQHFQ
ncbi:MAG: alpha/beta fold hydrolase [Deltaproteobacteria bacterium]|nr:alpha/beta fold hydrolase [Deltaproteobacteria bacterium]